MAGLERRLAQLEARRGGGPDRASGLAAERLAAMLARLEAAVVASGDASDRADASPVERAVRRYLRGEADTDEALRDLAEGRFP